MEGKMMAVQALPRLREVLGEEGVD